METTKKDHQKLQVIESKLPAGLYLVATPIGNLRDISLRALDTLQSVDVIACEDTRVSGKLLSAYGLSKQLIRYDDHTDSKQRHKIQALIEDGKSVALISDAGSPLISDPGFKMVRDFQMSGISVTTIPGASSPIAALQISGIESNLFTFAGFVPQKAGERLTFFQKIGSVPSTLIVFENAKRLQKTLALAHDVLGDRDACITRELTKLYEEARHGKLSELMVYYAENGDPKGEIVIVFAPPALEEISAEKLDVDIKEALKTMSVKDAAAYVSQASGKSKKDIYERALALSKSC